MSAVIDDVEESEYPYTPFADRRKRSRELRRTHKAKCAQLTRQIIELVGGKMPHMVCPANEREEPHPYDSRGEREFG